MSNTIRIRRRVTGLAGAPATLENGELAFNEVDNTLYYGKGIASGTTAATIIAIGGPGLSDQYVQITTNQSIAGTKTFTDGVLVPTVSGADNSTNAASTAWVRGFAQPLNSSLTALAGLSTVGLLVQTAAGVYAGRTITGTAGRVSVTDGNGASGNPTIDLSTSGVSAGTYTKLTVDVYGRATAGSNLSSSDVTSAIGFTPANAALIGANNGIASLDETGKVPVAQLPDSVLGGMQYKGVWNATTNSPPLASGVGSKGWYYKVSVAGNTSVDGQTNWSVGDIIVFNGAVWDKIEGGTPDVVSVAGRVGAVTLSNTDISGLGTMATQDSSSVSITGGSISGSTITGNISGNAANVTGIVGVANGGSGATSLTGYLRGNGTAAFTGVASIPNTDITGLGTLSTQNANAVAITGGTLAGVTSLGLRNSGTGAFDVQIAHSGTMTAARALTLNLNDAARSISLSGNLTVSSTATISGTNTGDQTISLTGDVTGSGTGSFAATIAPSSVTLSKMADLAANSLMGNNTGASATPMALTVAQVKTLLAISASDVSGLAAIATSGSAANLTTGTIPAGRMPALTGDVVMTAGTVATTIANSVVTLAKLANLPANTLIGNNTGASAAPVAVTVPQLKTMLALTNSDVSGLGSMALQNANAVAITGGTIDGVTFDGGTF